MSQFVNLDRRTKFLLLVGFMIVSLASLSAIPLITPWGADLHNVHIFEHCVAGRSPYLVEARACGDMWGRPFYYPPFLFAFFRWMQPLTLATSLRIWTAFLLVAFAGIFYAWPKKIAREPAHGERHELVTFCILLLLQYPFVFALERGNTDTVCVVFYTLAAYLFVRRQIWFAGMAAGIAAGFKLSPVIAVIVMTGALGWAWRRAGAWTWLRFGGGALTAFALTLLVFFREAKIYLIDVFPKYAKTLTPAREYAHSVPTFVGGDYTYFGYALGACLVFAWVWAAARAVARGDNAFAFAGSLAVSTYVQRTSFDYNLISAYPLLLLLFLRAQRTNRWALLAFGLFAIAGDRRLFLLPGAKVFTPQLHLTLELAFLVIAALVLARPDEPVEPSPAPATAPPST
jgi:glycosyl transferase family 87